jgi:ABC-type dipeptide/oligopeptide/nickel transport system permease component
MTAYVIRRLLQGIFVVFIVSFVTFFIIQAGPGDPIEQMLGEGAQQMTQEDLDNIREKWGLDDPWYEQYFRWLTNLAQGDLGVSVVRVGQPVDDMIFHAAGPTLRLNLIALLVAIAIAIPAGMVAALRRYSALDSAIMVTASGGVALPPFWVALMLIVLFTGTLGWLPATGFDSWKHYLMPVLVLAITEFAVLARLTRGTMLEVLNQDYMNTARSKGLSERVVVLRHAVRNAMLPIITVVGYRSAFLLSGTVVIETIFAVPGLGRLFYQSVTRSDYQVVQGIVLAFTLLVVFMNIVTDLLYAVIDPRIRLK